MPVYSTVLIGIVWYCIKLGIFFLFDDMLNESKQNALQSATLQTSLTHFQFEFCKPAESSILVFVFLLLFVFLLVFVVEMNLSFSV